MLTVSFLHCHKQGVASLTMGQVAGIEQMLGQQVYLFVCSPVHVQVSVQGFLPSPLKHTNTFSILCYEFVENSDATEVDYYQSGFLQLNLSWREGHLGLENSD